jgi:hypothetical protein
VAFALELSILWRLEERYMFFIMGITDGRKNLDFNQQIICEVCGRYGQYQLFMTYTALTLFFIPFLKWNKHYYVQTSCCNMLYELDPAIGKRIAWGEDIDIQPRNLRPVQTARRGGTGTWRRCANCGYETAENFEFCPKCGRRF